MWRFISLREWSASSAVSASFSSVWGWGIHHSWCIVLFSLIFPQMCEVASQTRPDCECLECC